MDQKSCTITDDTKMECVSEREAEQIMVSVICNVYNHERYIRDALEGFVSQKTNFGLEILIHDDASTDRSAEIIREYERKYPGLIKPIYQTENQYSKKISITYTHQMPRAKGKYIALCEGDDYWTDPLKLQKQFDYMEENPEYYLCVCSTAWQNMMTGRLENRGRADQDRDISLDEIILEEQGRLFQLASYFMKRELLDDVQSWRTAFPIGDLPIAIDAALRGKVRMLSDKMCVYRYYAAGSWTQRMDNDDHRVVISKRMINALTILNAATNYQHDAVIARRIRKHKYTLALMTHDLAAIKSDELSPIYKSRSLVLRVSDVFRCKYPKQYAFVRSFIKKFIR